MAAPCVVQRTEHGGGDGSRTHVRNISELKRYMFSYCLYEYALSITKKYIHVCSVIITLHDKKVSRNILSGLYVFNQLIDTPIKQEFL